MHGLSFTPAEAALFAVILFGPFVLGGLLWLAALLLRSRLPTIAAVCLLIASLFSLIGCHIWLPNRVPDGPLDQSLISLLPHPEFHAYLLAGMMSILAAVLSAADIVLVLWRKTADTKCFALALPIAAAGALICLADRFCPWQMEQRNLFFAVTVLLTAGGIASAAVVLWSRGKRGVWLCLSVAAALICCLAVVVWGNLIVALAGLAQ